MELYNLEDRKDQNCYLVPHLLIFFSFFFLFFNLVKEKEKIERKQPYEVGTGLLLVIFLSC